MVMVDRESSPLTQTCIKNLQDRIYEKRKAGALEIEKMVKEFMNLENYDEIERIMKVLTDDFINSSNCHARKGGLIGLAQTCIALGRNANTYCPQLVRPVLTCLEDPDSRVRYYACEALYNISKVTRDSILEFFNDIFDGMSKCCSDADPLVRKGCGELDRVMKNICMESPAFDIVAFIPLIRERIYTKNSLARMFIVSWISALNTVPDLNMLVFLPEFLDGLFQILREPNPEIRRKCHSVLDEYLHGVAEHPVQVNFQAMINLLVSHCQFGHTTNSSSTLFDNADSGDDWLMIQQTSLEWIHQFILLSQKRMLPYVSGILCAILPCLAYSGDSKKEARMLALHANRGLLQLVETEKEDENIPVKKDSTNAPTLEETGDDVAQKRIAPEDKEEILDTPATLEVLCRLARHETEQTRVASLRWIYELLTRRPAEVFLHIEEVYPLLLKSLCDSSETVLMLDIEILSKISSNQRGLDIIPHLSPNFLAVSEELLSNLPPSVNPYFVRIMVDLIHMFQTDRNMLEHQGSLVVRRLSVLLNAEMLFRTLAIITLHLDDVKFAFQMVQNLNIILLTSTELHDLRLSLKHLNNEDACSLFSCLYRAWCHNPVATLSLCLLSQNYHHASRLVRLFGEIEVTMDFLMEIDRLVQLLESPIFTYLRLHLLDESINASLQEALYGLLMCLPQTEAFQVLQRRLHCIPKLGKSGKKYPDGEDPEKRLLLKTIDFEHLLNHFRKVQEKHHLSSVTRNIINEIDQNLTLDRR